MSVDKDEVNDAARLQKVVDLLTVTSDHLAALWRGVREAEGVVAVGLGWKPNPYTIDKDMARLWQIGFDSVIQKSRAEKAEKALNEERERAGLAMDEATESSKAVADLCRVIDDAFTIDRGEKIERPQPHHALLGIMAGNRRSLREFSDTINRQAEDIKRLEKLIVKEKEFAENCIKQRDEARESKLKLMTELGEARAMAAGKGSRITINFAEVECRMCCGTGSVPCLAPPPPGMSDQRVCPGCNGHGKSLGTVTKAAALYQAARERLCVALLSFQPYGSASLPYLISALESVIDDRARTIVAESRP